MLAYSMRVAQGGHHWWTVLNAQYHPRNKLQVFGYSGRLSAMTAWSIVEVHEQYIRNDVLFFFLQKEIGSKLKVTITTDNYYSP